MANVISRRCRQLTATLKSEKPPADKWSALKESVDLFEPAPEGALITLGTATQMIGIIAEYSSLAEEQTVRE